MASLNGPCPFGLSITMLLITLQITVRGLFSQPRRHFGSGRGLCFSSKRSVTECNQILVPSYTGHQTSPSVSRRRFVGSSCFGRGTFSIYPLLEGRRIGCGWKEMVRWWRKLIKCNPQQFSHPPCLVWTNPRVGGTCHGDIFAGFLLQENHPIALLSCFW